MVGVAFGVAWAAALATCWGVGASVGLETAAACSGDTICVGTGVAEGVFAAAAFAWLDLAGDAFGFGWLIKKISKLEMPHIVIFYFYFSKEINSLYQMVWM
jgi:hypothetical protein